MMAPVVERSLPRSSAPPKVEPPKQTRPIPASADDPLLRVWTDRTGSFTVTARFGGMQGTLVTLKKLDGTPIKLEFDRLSEADQAWINDRRRQ
ncbi:SHD1 domain-containing protein [Anatilimnocola floriformis]|uniref:SHD1 domain-containing protein n=1 Tax=Anatilimnocola floriformis TaxID=2948575 RepID=UPI0020C3EFE6|nr:SHD1 domain-containing protein [Anatilimnocola floriformis]